MPSPSDGGGGVDDDEEEELCTRRRGLAGVDADVDVPPLPTRRLAYVCL